MLRRVYIYFTSHPASVGETYGQHFWFASRFGVRLLLSGLAAMVHGLLPFAFQKTASRAIIDMYDEIKNR